MSGLNSEAKYVNEHDNLGKPLERKLTLRPKLEHDTEADILQHNIEADTRA